jgi:RNA polymerase-binding protein DksA
MGKKKPSKKGPTGPPSSRKKPQKSTPKKNNKKLLKSSKKGIPHPLDSQSESAPRQSPRKQNNMAGEAKLTPQDLDHFRQLLIQKLHEILGDVNWIEDEALRKSRQDATGDLSTMPIHMADLGTDNYEQEFSLGLMDSERKIVHEILDALRRIAMGTYGICEGTGKPIPRARLEANPWARYCVEYASQIEQGKVIEKKHSRPLSFENEEDDDRDTPDRDEDEDAFLEEEHSEDAGEDDSFLGGLPDEDDGDLEEEELL